MERIAGGVLHSVTWAMLEMRCASLFFFSLFLIAGRVRDRRREEGAGKHHNVHEETSHDQMP